MQVAYDSKETKKFMSPIFSLQTGVLRGGFQSWQMPWVSASCLWGQEDIYLVPSQDFWQSRDDTFLQTLACLYNSINVFQETLHEVSCERQTWAARKQPLVMAKMQLSGSIGSMFWTILLSTWTSSLFSYLLTTPCSQKYAKLARHTKQLEHLF